MAKSSTNNTDATARKLIAEAATGSFRQVYLLMGEEAYYPETVCQAIIEHCIPEEDKDFNETICYGADVTAEQVISAARRFPMMAERQLVVVKEAQMMADIEELANYCRAPLDSTVLVILMRGASADKRKSLYKEASKSGVVLDSPAIRDYAIAEWISAYYAGRGLRIDPAAATLLGESTGTDLTKIALETDKLLKNLPEGTVSISPEDIEKNIGVSRQFSIFELTRELSYRNAAKALNIASHIGTAAKFNMPQAVSALYTHFSRILKYAALKSAGNMVSPEDKARALAGVNPYFYREYDAAVQNYPLPKAMAAMSLLCEYDYRGKGGDGESTEAAELLRELTAKLLSL